MTKLTDRELVLAYANGDNSAFDVLLSRHQKGVFDYILHLVNDYDKANDIFQDTFIKAISMIRQGRYDDSGKFPAWLNRVAHNHIIDLYRRAKTANTISNDADEEIDLFNNRDLCEGSIEDELIQTQFNEDLRRMLLSLPEDQQQVVHMRMYLDLSFKEIAEITGVSINTALGRMRYALRNLRRLAAETHLLEAV